MSKRYFWLKLQTNFFNSDELKVVESQKNGEKYVVFWMKLLLKAIEQEEPGRLRFKDNIPYDDKTLSVVTGTDIDTVRVAIELFKQLGMLTVMENGDFWIESVRDMVGTETKWAQYKRVERKQLDNVQIESKNSPTELELELEKEIKKEKSTGEGPAKPDPIPYSEIIDHLNTQCETSYRAGTRITKEKIAARWAEGFRAPDFKMVIDWKVERWSKDPKMYAYLRPETLFGPKFESYLNEIPPAIRKDMEADYVTT